VKSIKQLAPGAIMQAPGTVDDDHRGWVMTHDASTLGGNSGSALVDLDASGRTVLGLEGADTGAFDPRIIRIAATITKD